MVIACLASLCVYRVVRWALNILFDWVLDFFVSKDTDPGVTPEVQKTSSVSGVEWIPIHSRGRERLRRRSRWVCSLQQALNGEVGAVAALFRGRWVPDLPSLQRGRSVNFLAALTSDGVQFLGGGLCYGKGEDGSSTPVAYVSGQTRDGWEFQVFPSLVAKLSNHALFRTRNAALLALLRLRALEWRREQGLDHYDLAFGLADSVCLASLETAWEVSASQCLAMRGLMGKVDV
jgi:hypothetical protein